MPTPTIEEFGRALFGEEWKAPTEQLLGVDNRTMRRWIADPSAVPAGAIAELYESCAVRAQVLSGILAQKEERGFQRQVTSHMQRTPPRDR